MSIISKEPKNIRIKKVLITTFCAIIAICLAISFNGKPDNSKLNTKNQVASTSGQTLNQSIIKENNLAEVLAMGEAVPNSQLDDSYKADKIALSYKMFNQFLVIILALFAYDLIKSFSNGISSIISNLLGKISRRIDRQVLNNSNHSSNSSGAGRIQIQKESK